MKLQTITPLRVEDFQQNRIRQVSPATVYCECARLKHAFDLAERWGMHPRHESGQVGKIPAGEQSSLPRKRKRDKHRCDSIRNVMGSGKIENGGMAEWLKAAVLKTVSGVTRSGVRIPLPPPDTKMTVVGI